MKGLAAGACAVFLYLNMHADCLHAFPVPDTGDDKCYNDTVEIACPSPGQNFYGQDGNYSINPPHYTKLDATGNVLPDNATAWTMVHDEVTGLIWEEKHHTDNATNYADPNNTNNVYTWYDGVTGTPGDNASTYDTQKFINSLNAAYYGGHNDWRLPTAQELATIVDSSRCHPAINTAYFLNTKAAGYWSSVANAAFPSTFAWCTDFDAGSFFIKNINGPSYVLYVRAVRTAGGTANFIDNGDGTVSDTNTGLMWQQSTAPGTHTWQQALAYCYTLNLAGHSDWRLPTWKELQSIIDYSIFNPSISYTFFSDTKPNPYWSSTTRPYNIFYSENPDNAWAVGFNSGECTSDGKGVSKYVRAVRSSQTASSTTTTSIFSIDFTATPVQGPVPLEVQFTDASSPEAAGHTWDFGDGTGVTGISPIHIYQESGAYTVSLIVSGPNSLPVKMTKLDFIRVSETAPVADFSASVTEGRAPLTVMFTDTSTGTITGREWNFGDGETGKLTIMRHTFATAGLYTVSLKVEGPDGTSIKTREAFITVNPGFRTSVISGRVTGDTQAGISINLSGAGVSLSGQTGADGAYSFAGVPSNRYRITPIRPGFVFEPSGASVRVRGRDVTGVDFTAKAAGPDITAVTAEPERVSANGLMPVKITAGVSHPESLGALSRVTADLTSIGGLSHAQLNDDGTTVDAGAGDGVYTLETFVMVGTQPGLQAIAVTAADRDGLSRTAFAALDVYKEFSGSVEKGATSRHSIENGLDGQTVRFTLTQTGSVTGSSTPSCMQRSPAQSGCIPTVVVIGPDQTQYTGQTGGAGNASGQTIIEIPDAAAGQWTCSITNPCDTTIGYGLASDIAGTGIVSGMVVDARTGQGITGASLLSTGGIGAQTDLGVYVMLHPSGIFSLAASAVDYLPSRKPLTVNAGGTTEMNLALDNGTTTGACFLKKSLGEGSQEVQMLRRFRDSVLGGTAEGRRYIRLYYRYNGEIAAMMRKDAALAEDISRCGAALMPLAEVMLRGKLAEPDGSQRRLLVSCLTRLRADSGTGLRAEIDGLLQALEQERPFNRLLQ
jgi:PKD repeat protein